MKKNYVLAGAIIVRDGKILCCKRGENEFDYIANKWEFPGGKVEQGESPSDAIRREILEELKLEVVTHAEFCIVEYEYPDFTITLHAFICQVWNYQPFELKVHTTCLWLAPRALTALDWLAGDISIVNKLMKEL